jgi:hypothetical protein
MCIWSFMVYSHGGNHPIPHLPHFRASTPVRVCMTSSADFLELHHKAELSSNISRSS